MRTCCAVLGFTLGINVPFVDHEVDHHAKNVNFFVGKMDLATASAAHGPEGSAVVSQGKFLAGEDTSSVTAADDEPELWSIGISERNGVSGKRYESDGGAVSYRT